MWRRIKKGFEAQHPKISLSLEHWPVNYSQRLRESIKSDSPPDVISIRDEGFPEYAAEGKFEGLKPYIKTTSNFLSADDFLPYSLEAFWYKDNQYAMPWGGGMIVLYYNRRLFREVNVPYPDKNWDWFDFLEAARKLTWDVDEDGNPDLFGVSLSSWWPQLLNWIWGAGGDFLNASRTKCLINQPQAIAGMQFYQDLSQKYHVAPKVMEFMGMGQEVVFLRERVAMLFNGPWVLTFLRNPKNKIDWDIAHIPTGPKGRATRVTFDGLAISKDSKYKAEAWEFIKYAISSSGQKEIAAYGQTVPALRSALKDEALLRPDTPQHEEVFIEAVEYIKSQPITENWKDMGEIIQKEMDKFTLGIQDAAQMAKNVEREVNELLSK